MNSPQQKREFHLGDVLSITTHRMLSPRNMDGVVDIVTFMIKGVFYPSFGFLRASEICRTRLLEQFPQLREMDISGVNERNYKKWLAKQVAKYGEKLLVDRSAGS